MTLIMLATISAELMCSERMHRKKFVTDIGCPETRGKRIAGLVEDAAYGRQRSLSRLQISAPLGHCLLFHAYLPSGPHSQSGTAPARTGVCKKLLNTQ